MELNNLKLFELWSSTKITSEFELAVQKELAVPISPVDVKKIRSLSTFLKRKWLESSRTKNRFAARNSTWLSGLTTFAKSTNLEHKPSTSQGQKRGRPTKSLEECSESTRKRKLQESTKDIQTIDLSQALSTKYEKDQDKTRAQLTRVIQNASPEELQKIKKNISGPAKIFPTDYTPEDAFGLFKELGLSKEKYIFLRKSLIRHRVQVLPKYDTITEAKKNASPPKIQITEDPLLL